MTNIKQILIKGSDIVGLGEDNLIYYWRHESWMSQAQLDEIEKQKNQ